MSSAASSVRSIGAPPATAAPRALLTKRARGVRRLSGWLFILPAFTAYAIFVLWPIVQTFRYSLYNWDGVAPQQWAGVQNFKTVFSNGLLLGVIGHAFELILFFSGIPVVFGLLIATVMRRFVTGRMSVVARTVLFLPQVVPLVAAGIAWNWMMSTSGAIDEILSKIGLGSLARPWLGDFSTALPGVGIIGAWVLLGLCTVLLLAGMTKIDAALYEAAQLDGASAWREFLAITFPALRQELAVCVTVTVIAALSAFDIVYIATQGGPGNATMVPGLEIYRLAFYNRQVGLASALALVLMVLVIACVLPVQWFARRGADQ